MYRVCLRGYVMSAVSNQDGRNRGAVRPGLCVDIVLKQDQRSGKKTRGIVREILTNSTFHPHGIKVKLADGKVGRVAAIIREEAPDDYGDPGEGTQAPG